MGSLAGTLALPASIGVPPVKRRRSKTAPAEAESNAAVVVDPAIEAAFGDLFRRSYATALRLAQSLVGNAAAEDVVQRVFLRLWKRASDPKRKPIPFGDENRCRALILHSVRNETTSVGRLAKTAKKYASALAYEFDFVVRTVSHPVSGPGPMSFRELVHRAADQMPPIRAAVFRMCKFDKMKYREVAEALGISPSTVHGHLVAANKFLHKYLEPYRPAAGKRWSDVDLEAIGEDVA